MTMSSLAGTVPFPQPDSEPSHSRPIDDRSVSDCLRDSLEQFFRDLDGTEPPKLYQMVLDQVEPTLLSVVLEHTRGNQTQAATMLGLSRGTLRKKLRQHGLYG